MRSDIFFYYRQTDSFLFKKFQNLKEFYSNSSSQKAVNQIDYTSETIGIAILYKTLIPKSIIYFFAKCSLHFDLTFVPTKEKTKSILILFNAKDSLAPLSEVILPLASKIILCRNASVRMVFLCVAK